jgi:hypothetical protein
LAAVLGPLLLAMAAAVAASHARTPPCEAPTIEAGAAPMVLARFPRPVLAIAFASATRVLLLEDDRVSLWRLTAGGLSWEAERLAPAPVERTRRPGGLIRAAAGTPDFWVLRSGWPEALLFTYEDRPDGIALTSDSGAEALPWPAATNGLRFRPGTNLIDGVLEGLGASPYVALSADGTIAVDADNLLRRPGGGAPLRVGSAVARPWSDFLVASSPTTRAPDSLVAVALAEPDTAAPLAGVEGLIRAIATSTEKDAAVLLASVDAGDSHLVMRLDLKRRLRPQGGR